MAQGQQKFASKENLQKCLDIFVQFLRERKGVSIKDKEYTSLKRLMFETMKSAQKQVENPDHNIYELNMFVLKTVQDTFFQKMMTTAPPTKEKPNVMNLERERDVFGGRNVQVNELIPQRDPYLRRPNSPTDHELPMHHASPVVNALEQMQRERSNLTKANVPDMSCFGSPISEEAYSEEDFANKLKHLEDRRSGVDFTIEKEFHEANAVENVDIRNLYSAPSLLIQDGESGEHEKVEDADVSRLLSIQQLHDSNMGLMLGQQDAERKSLPINTFPQQPQHVCVPKYISINSTDRNWMNDVMRYQYSVTFNGGGEGAVVSNFKNIRSISVGKVIIPDEIMERQHPGLFDGSSHTSFNHEFSFSYPYLILRIDELDDVYDGTNNSVRKSFCKLIYSKSYKAPNGRGYIILKPLQNEKKTFYPTPMSSLNRLSLSFLKPNGFLLNASADSYKLWKVSYDTFNPHYYQIITNVFFDKNEFFVGDGIIIKGFTIQGTTRAYQETQLVSYLNRAEGHEIMQIGQVNDNGYWRSFFIKAIGIFDRVNGRFDVDQDVISCLNEYNDTIDWTQQADNNGCILNSSLQNTIGMSIEVLVNATSSQMTSQLV